jgi:hypothetical protein
MKRCFEVIGVLCACLVISSAVSGQEKFKGNYLIYSGDRLTDNDEYEVVTGREYNDDIRSVSGDRKEQEHELVYGEGQFQYYRYTLNGASDVRVTAEKDILTFYDSTAMVGALPIAGPVIVGDPAVYTHYAMLLGVYDEQKGGKQALDVVVPSLQDFIPIEIERHGSDGIKLSDRNIEAVHYRIVLGKKKDVVNAWVDGKHVIGLYFVSKNRYVVDAGYDNLYERIKQIVNRAM